MTSNTGLLVRIISDSKNEKSQISDRRASYCCLDLKVNCRQAKDLYNSIKDQESYLGQIVSFHYSNNYKPNEEWPLMSNNFLDKYQNEDTIFFKVDINEPKVTLEEAVGFFKKTMENVSSLKELTSSSGVLIDDKDNQKQISFFPR